ncbi:sensor histidine kinase [Alkalicoccus daliensis]|uniref:Two-component system, sensor histidine kinase YesM n=1 Tax=Alkalicoccus daliensis TaxID=745820 RepID=A0A1H0E869_9BACI|nr:sensor histidine kinase [Alkalicoccus daliensis]SDN78511.1 two-component system, sensor histidine kinase YesM [Alkalicoccus daliensis]
MIFKKLKLRRVKNYSLRRKLILTYVLLTLLPLIFLAGIAHSQYAKSIELQAAEHIPSILNQANRNIDTQIADIEKLPDLITSSPDISAVLADNQYRNQSLLLRDEFKVNRYLSNTFLQGINPDILAVFIHSNDRVFSSSRIGVDGAENYESFLPYGDEYDLRNEVKKLPSFHTPITFDDDIPFILVMKEIIDVDNRKNLGTMSLAVDIAFFDEILADLDARADVWMMDDNNQIIYHLNDKEQIGNRFDQITALPIENGTIKMPASGGDYLLSVSTSENTGWSLVHRIESSYLTDRTDVVSNIIMGVLIALAVVTIAISFVLAWSVTKPIHRLRVTMKAVEEGDLDTDFNTPVRQDEVGMLTTSFHSMIIKLRELIRINYITTIKQQEAELYALQSQINPHFLYNTLESLTMAVEEQEEETAVEVISLLGKMLRYSLNNKDDVVSIDKEVEHARDYLTIQKFRYEDQLEFHISENIDAEKLITPKFILQPIVENAVKYALKNKACAAVSVSISEEINKSNSQQDILFSIHDNGTGLSSEDLNSLKQTLNDNPMMKKDEKFGLVNVHGRLVMLYGEDYGISIWSERGSGTTVTLRIPKIYKEYRGDLRRGQNQGGNM